MRLLLWDVDLTLMQAGVFGRSLYAAAFEHVTGHPLRVPATTAGRLDPDIFRDALLSHELDPADHSFPRFAEALAANYAAGRDELRHEGRALPGAAAALAALAAVPGVVQTVLTGNIAPVARIKLAAFDLDRHLDLEIGAYGADERVRANLVPMAQRRAGAKHAAVFDRSNTVIIGDTPHDVAAGRVGGARVVAVASGRTPASELRAAGADVVLPDLTDTAAVLRAIAG